MVDLFAIRKEQVTIKGLTLGEVLDHIKRADENMCKVCNNGIYIKTANGTYSSLKCIGPYLSKEISSKSKCKEVRSKLSINLKQQDCEACYKQAIEKYLDFKYF